VLEYRHVGKRFGDFVALAGLSAEVRKGEVVCLIGPTGSGKSTLLRCTNGLELIDDGEIALDGKLLPRDWDGMRRVRQRMGMVFQNFELFPHKTVLGNVTVGRMTVLRMPRKDAEKRALDLLEKVGLAGKATSYPSQLSGGQQQTLCDTCGIAGSLNH
jgi:polar amino acid transport system ATP-binding protein